MVMFPGFISVVFGFGIGGFIIVAANDDLDVCCVQPSFRGV